MIKKVLNNLNLEKINKATSSCGFGLVVESIGNLSNVELFEGLIYLYIPMVFIPCTVRAIPYVDTKIKASVIQSKKVMNKIRVYTKDIISKL